MTAIPPLTSAVVFQQGNSGDNRFQLLFENSLDAILIANEDGRYLEANEAAAEMFGIPVEQLKRMGVTDLVTPVDASGQSPATAGEQYAAYVQTGRQMGEFTFVRPDGEVHTAEYAACQLAQDLHLSILRDVTDRNRRAALDARIVDELRAASTLDRIGRHIAVELDLSRLLQTITDEATALVRAQFGSFFYNEIDERGESYTMYALSGAPREAFAGFPMPRNTALFGPTFRGEGIVRSDDITQDSRYGRNAPYHGMPEGHLPVRSYLAAPVQSRTGEVFGGLFFGHADPGVFDDRAEQNLASLAAQAGVAIDNARLFENAQREIAERKRAERLRDGQKSILEQIARGTDLPVILHAVTELVESEGEALICSVLVLDGAGKRLHLGAAPGLPDEYNLAIEGIRIGPSVGSCGTAAYRKEAVIVSDVATDPLWADFRDIALRHGLRACWSSPVLSSTGEVLGTVAIYRCEPSSPTTRQHELLETACYLAGIAIERDRNEQALRQQTEEITALNNRLRRAMTETHHRVKNNLQIISAMIDMEVMEGEAVQPAELKRLGSHIKTLAVVHDLLTQEAKAEGAVEAVSGREVMEHLLPLLNQTNGSRSVGYRLEHDALLTIRQATSLAVITNELVNNSVKHGGKKIDVRFAVEGGRITLEVCDDGPGFPRGFVPSDTDSTGVALVSNLSRWDLGGEARFSNRPEGGARAVVTFASANGGPGQAA